jgi:plastocyanin
MHCVFALGLTMAAAEVFAANVTISNFQFNPSTLTINIGDSVTWLNQDTTTHTTTSTSPNGPWNGTLAPGASFTQTFSKEGSYTYLCSLHPSMTGSVVVRSPEQTRIQTGKNLVAGSAKTVPISLNLAGKNQDLAYLGSYIVNAQSGCANCHSCPTYAKGHNPFLGESKQFNASGYLAGGVPVGGIVSANITPDSSGKPAGLSLGEFKSLLRTGHDPDVPGALLQVMPWPIFGMMSSHDLDAVYEYLRAIPSRKTPGSQACSGMGD